MPQFALQMRQISKSYGSIRANDRITFDVEAGTIHALAGENGAGKSTLMKILFGLLKPDPVAHVAPSRDGSADEPGIFIHGKKVSFSSPQDAIENGIGMVQQHFALAGAISALDNIILGAEPSSWGVIDRQQAEATLKSLAGEHLKVPWGRHVEDLPVGMQQRLEILKLLFRRANILILDEPTAVLTPQEVEVFFALLRSLRAEGKTVILITHKLQEVLSLCDNVTVLRAGKVSGSFSTRGLTQAALVRAMIGRDVRSLPKTVMRPGAVILSCQNLGVAQPHGGSLRGLSLSVAEGEIVGVAGVEGHGQSTLIEVLLALKAFSGEVSYRGQPLPTKAVDVRQRLNVGLISEDRHEQSLWLEASIADNMVIGFAKKFSRGGFMGAKKIRHWARDLLGPYGVKMQSVDQPVGALSGGNQQKVVVAREVTARNPDFLIASQPTRGVDVGAIEFIHEQILRLRERQAGILLISSELEELCALSDRIVVLYEGRAVCEFRGPEFDLAQIGRAMTSGGEVS